MKRLLNYFKLIQIFVLIFVLSIISSPVNGEVYYQPNNGTIFTGDETLPVYTISKACSDRDAFIILFSGDGYTKDQQSTFLNLANQYTKTLLGIQPFKAYSDKINVYAVPVVSNQSGASYSDLYSSDTVDKDTYYKVTQVGKAGIIPSAGKEKAQKIISALEKDFLDYEGDIGAVHILSNSDNYFGAAESFYSCASINSQYTGGIASVHELAHTIGGLYDEYKTAPDLYYPNISTTNDSQSVPWKDFWGFRGVGAVSNSDKVSSYIPTSSCIMNSLSAKGFCEVCKAELARRMNLSYRTKTSKDYYIADPELKISNNNIEFRTIVQNLKNNEANFKLKIKVSGSNGQLKYQNEQTFDVPALKNEYSPEDARKNLLFSISKDTAQYLENDTVTGEVIDVKKNEVIATNKTDKQVLYRVNINHKIKNKDGSITSMPNTYTTTVYVPKNTIYKFNTIDQINGYTYFGNNLNSDTITASYLDNDVDFYYSVDENMSYLDTKVSDNKKSVAINPVNIPKSAYIIVADYNNQSLMHIDIYPNTQNSLIADISQNATSIKIMAWESLDDITPVCKSVNYNLSK